MVTKSNPSTRAYEQEPLLENSPLRSLDNVSMVPHIGSTPGALEKMRETAVWNVLRVAQGEPPLNIKTPEAYYKNKKWAK